MTDTVVILEFTSKPWKRYEHVNRNVSYQHKQSERLSARKRCNLSARKDETVLAESMIVTSSTYVTIMNTKSDLKHKLLNKHNFQFCDSKAPVTLKSGQLYCNWKTRSSLKIITTNTFGTTGWQGWTLNQNIHGYIDFWIIGIIT